MNKKKLLVLGLFSLVIATSAMKLVSVRELTSNPMISGNTEQAFAAADYPRECTDLMYGGDATDYETYQTWCSEFKSKFDGTLDHFFIHFPPSLTPGDPAYDVSKPVPIILWFKAYGNTDGQITDPRMYVGHFQGETATAFKGIPATYGAIVIGMHQRNNCNFLGDNYQARDPEDDCYDEGKSEGLSRQQYFEKTQQPAYRDAAKKDVEELVNQLAAKFSISHVFAAGASMGGYTSLRLLSLYPALFSGAITSATALCVNPGNNVNGSPNPPPNCGGQNPDTNKIYAAAAAGAFANKLIYMVIGAADDTTGLLDGVHYLRDQLKDDPLLHYSEIPGVGHENFFADDYNVTSLGYEAWLIDNQAVPALEKDITDFVATHAQTLKPEAGWTAPASPGDWYLTSQILGFAKSSAPATTTTSASPASAGAFSDVPSTHVNAEAIAYVKTNGIVAGYPDGTYKPDQTINRAEFTKIIVGAVYDAATIDGCVAQNAQPGWKFLFFPDVPTDAWFSKYVCVAKTKGLISGYPDGTFKPTQNINFVEAAKILTYAFKLPLVGTPLVPGMPEPPWYAVYTRALNVAGDIPLEITSLSKLITRGDMAELTYRLKAGITDKPTRQNGLSQ